MLKLRHLFATAVVGLSLTPYIAGGPAFADDDRQASRSTSVARHGFWDIRVHQDGSCFAIADYEYDQHIRVGITDAQNYYIMLTSPGVDKLRVTEGFPIIAKFDNGEGFKGKSTVKMLDNGSRKMLAVDIGSSMLNSFMVASNMRIYAQTKQVGELLIATMNLSGSYAAMLKAAECSGAAEAYRERNGGQPVSKPRPPKANPFDV